MNAQEAQRYGLIDAIVGQTRASRAADRAEAVVEAAVEAQEQTSEPLPFPSTV